MNESITIDRDEQIVIDGPVLKKPRKARKSKKTPETAVECTSLVPVQPSIDIITNVETNPPGWVSVEGGVQNEAPAVIEPVPAEPTAADLFNAFFPHVEPAPKKVRKGPGKNDYRMRDDLSTPLGTMGAKVNACLTLQGKTMKEIMAEIGSDNTWYEHLAVLVNEGLIVKEGKTYRRKSDAEKAI